MTERKLQKLAREEIQCWKYPVREYARIVLACFVFRVIRGVAIETMFAPQKEELDYQI